MRICCSDQCKRRYFIRIQEAMCAYLVQCMRWYNVEAMCEYLLQ